jgi:hypothetical protein
MFRAITGDDAERGKGGATEKRGRWMRVHGGPVEAAR